MKLFIFDVDGTLIDSQHHIHGAMTHAEEIDRNGFFIGNHHYDIADAIGIVAAFQG